MAYRAEIEIGVKGAEKLAAFQKSLKETNKVLEIIDGYSDFFSAPLNSLKNYTKNLKEAAKALQLVEIGTQEETTAIRNYVQAAAQAATVRDRNNKLMDEEAQKLGLLSQKLREYNAAAAPPRQAGGSLAGRYLRPGSAVSRTQFGAPIGPEPGVQFGSATQFGPVGGPSSSVLGGQSFPIEQRLARLIQAQKEELELKKALQKLDEKSIRNLNKKKDLQAELQVILNATVKEAQLNPVRAAFRAEGADRRSGFLKLQEAENRAKLEAARNTAQLAGEQKAHNRVIKEAELRFEESKAAAREVTQAENERRAALDKTTTAIKKNTRSLRRFLGASDKDGRAGRKGNPFVGAAFPALFGGGPGAIIGGFIGELFGPLGGVVGSAIGQSTVDPVVRNITELGNALTSTTPDIEALVKAIGAAGTATGDLIKAIEQAEGAQVAQGLAAEKMAIFVGKDGVRALEDAGRASTKLGNEAEKAFTALSAALAPALTAVANFLAKGITEQRQLSRVDPGIFGLFKGDLADNPAVKDVRKRLLEGLISEKQARKEILQIVSEIEEVETRIFDKRLQGFRTITTSGQEAANALRTSKVNLEITKRGNDLADDTVFKLRKQNVQLAFKEKRQKLINTKVKTQADEIIVNTQLKALENDETAELLSLEEKRNQALENSAKKRKQALENLNRLRLQGLRAELTISQKIIDVNRALVNEGRKGLIEPGLFGRFEQSVNQKQIELQVNEITKALREAKTASGAALFSEQDIATLQNYYRVALTSEQQLQDLQRQRKAVLDEINKAQQERDLIKRYVEPIKQIREQQEQSLQTQKDYNRLLMEGILPTEAKRIAAFNEQVRLQTQLLDQTIKTAKADIARARANGATEEALAEQLRILQQLEKARGEVQIQAAEGPGPAAEQKSPAMIVKERIGTLQEELDALTNMGNQVVRMADIIGDAFANAFTNVITGTTSVRQAVADMFQQVGRAFISMAIEIIAKQLVMIALQKTFNALSGGGLFGGLLGGLGGGASPFASAFGNMSVAGPSFFGGGMIPGFQNGGRPEPRKVAIVGENGPELFIPDGYGRIIPNGRYKVNTGGIGGAPNTITVNVDARSTDVQGDDDKSRQLGTTISRVIQAELVRQQRPGGLLHSTR